MKKYSEFSARVYYAMVQRYSTAIGGATHHRRIPRPARNKEVRYMWRNVEVGCGSSEQGVVHESSASALAAKAALHVEPTNLRNVYTTRCQSCCRQQERGGSYHNAHSPRVTID